MSNILITGGGGFIGRNLIEFLLRGQVKNIVVVDNFITSDIVTFTDFQKKMNEKVGRECVALFRCDITMINFIVLLGSHLYSLSIDGIDEIYHLASIASPPFYKRYPVETLDVGYKGTQVVLELARLYVAKVLFTSTSEVYGDPSISPQDERYNGNVNSFGARSCYDESKRVGEALCYTYLTKHGVDVKIARIFNSYGPHMLLDDGRIITECIRHLKNKTKMTIYGDGKQTRSCCFVGDTVSMLVKLMATSYNRPVNVGSDDERTINDTVRLVNQIWNEMHDTNDVLEFEYVKLTENDPLRRKPCLKLNKKVLGETEYTSFKEGIRRTIEYFDGM